MVRLGNRGHKTLYTVILSPQDLVSAREKKGVSLRVAAAAMGISFGLLGKLERGEKQVGLKSALGISRYYRIAMNRIVKQEPNGATSAITKPKPAKQKAGR